MEPGETWDGEIYNHGWSLQRTVSAVKKWDPFDTTQLIFMNYDKVNKDPFEDRFGTPEPDDYDIGTFITTVPTTLIHDFDEMERLHDVYVKEGYEGIILRNPQGLYKKGGRSSDLLKFKKFEEDEFEIISTGVEVQTINNDTYNCIMFRCKTKMGAEFNCRPKGTLAYRQEMLEKANTYIGKQLTVRYFALTDSTQGSGQGVPQFPVGIIVRDYE